MIDLRSSAELRSEARGRSPSDVRLHHVPLFDGEVREEDRERAAQITLADRYVFITELAGERIARVVTIVRRRTRGRLPLRRRQGPHGRDLGDPARPARRPRRRHRRRLRRDAREPRRHRRSSERARGLSRHARRAAARHDAREAGNDGRVPGRLRARSGRSRTTRAAGVGEAVSGACGSGCSSSGPGRSRLSVRDGQPVLDHGAASAGRTSSIGSAIRQSATSSYGVSDAVRMAVRAPAAPRHRQHLVDRADHERRTGRDEEIAARRRAQRAVEIVLHQRLAERDRGRLPGAAAGAARHRLARLPGSLRHGARLAAVAAHALDRRVGAVDVHEPLGGKPLRSCRPSTFCVTRSVDATAPGERGERQVRRIGLRRADHLPGLALVAPVAGPGLLGGEELLDRHRPVLRPATAGRAEVGDARRGRHAGAGEHDDPAARHATPRRASSSAVTARPRAGHLSAGTRSRPGPGPRRARPVPQRRRCPHGRPSTTIGTPPSGSSGAPGGQRELQRDRRRDPVAAAERRSPPSRRRRARSNRCAVHADKRQQAPVRVDHRDACGACISAAIAMAPFSIAKRAGMASGAAGSYSPSTPNGDGFHRQRSARQPAAARGPYTGHALPE